MQTDGKIIIGGNFPSMSGIVRNFIARVSSDGTLDPGFAPNANSEVSEANVLADGKILIAGTFTSVRGTARKYLARLNTDGTLDSGFDPNPDGGVSCTTVQVDGKIIIGGFFATLQPNGEPNSTSKNSLARLNVDGTLDLGFNASVSGVVFNTTLQTDGKIIIGGSFTNVNGVTRNQIARLLPDGTDRQHWTRVPKRARSSASAGS